MNNANDEPTIGMLLDTEHLYGVHEGRLAPVLTSLIISCIPILAYVYFGLFMWFPVWLFSIIEVIIIARVIMIIPGREKYRLENFRKRLYDDFTEVEKYMNIKRIYDDGLVEFINGKVCYAVKCYNGTCEDHLERTRQMRKFILSLTGDFIYDTYILNDNSTGSMRRYYSTVHRFGRNTASSNFTKIIDLMRTNTRNKSMVQCTVILIYGTKSDWKQMKLQIDGAIGSKMAKVFKSVERVKDHATICELIDTDMDTSVNIDDLLRAKYKTGEYYTSKVISYDPKEEIVIGKDEYADTTKTNGKAKKSTFHVKYQEESDVTEQVDMAVAKPEYYEPIVIGGKSIEEKENRPATEEREQIKREKGLSNDRDKRLRKTKR